MRSWERQNEILERLFEDATAAEVQAIEQEERTVSGSPMLAQQAEAAASATTRSDLQSPSPSFCPALVARLRPGTLGSATKA